MERPADDTSPEAVSDQRHGSLGGQTIEPGRQIEALHVASSRFDEGIVSWTAANLIGRPRPDHKLERMTSGFNVQLSIHGPAVIDRVAESCPVPVDEHNDRFLGRRTRKEGIRIRQHPDGAGPSRNLV